MYKLDFISYEIYNVIENDFNKKNQVIYHNHIIIISRKTDTPCIRKIYVWQYFYKSD